MAVCGESRVVKIFDRQGNNKIEMPLKNTAKVVALEWDMDSESVAILQVRSFKLRKLTLLLFGRLELKVLQKLTCLLKKIWHLLSHGLSINLCLLLELRKDPLCFSTRRINERSHVLVNIQRR